MRKEAEGERERKGKKRLWWPGDWWWPEATVSLIGDESDLEGGKGAGKKKKRFFFLFLKKNKEGKEKAGIQRKKKLPTQQGTVCPDGTVPR